MRIMRNSRNNTGKDTEALRANEKEPRKEDKIRTKEKGSPRMDKHKKKDKEAVSRSSGNHEKDSRKDTEKDTEALRAK